LRAEIQSQTEEMSYWKEKYKNIDHNMSTRLEQTLKKLFETENALDEMRKNY